MFKINLQIHEFKQVLEILQHTCSLGFSIVFAFMRFFNKDRLVIDISDCFEEILFILKWRKEFNLMHTRCTKTELVNLIFNSIFRQHLTRHFIFQEEKIPCSVKISARTVLFSAVQCRSIPPYSAVQFCTVNIRTPVQCCPGQFSTSQCVSQDKIVFLRHA